MINKKLYKVEFVKEKLKHSTIYWLNVTHNGQHWATINITDPDYEIPLIIKELENYYTKPLKNFQDKTDTKVKTHTDGFKRENEYKKHYKKRLKLKLRKGD